MGGTSDANGGNVIITGAGTHRIINTTISGGQASGDGGNVYIETDGTVRVEGSSFVDGTSSQGGGLAIVGAGGVEIVETAFIGNMASQGGGFFTKVFTEQDAGQLLVIDSSRFIGNSAATGPGGGFLIDVLGQMPSVAILASEFTDNSAKIDGAAGLLVPFLQDTDFTLESNTGSNNVGGPCVGFLAKESPATANFTCLAVTDSYPL
jgi:hypothetical protein